MLGRIPEIRSCTVDPEGFEDPPDSSQPAFDKALELRERGELGASRVLLEEVLTRRIEEHGETHHQTVCARSQLGRTLRAIGRLESARRLHEENLAIRREQLGDVHEFTKNSMRILATTLEMMGESEEADRLHSEATTPAPYATLSESSLEVIRRAVVQSDRDGDLSALRGIRRILARHDREGDESAISGISRILAQHDDFGDLRMRFDLPKKDNGMLTG